MRTSSVKKAIEAALRSTADNERALSSFSLEYPENPAHGDYATNIALVLAPFRKQRPLDIAQDIAASLRHNTRVTALCDRIDVAPPGFINFFLKPSWLQKEMLHIIRKGNAYGRIPRKGPKTNIEFISANPTGPLTLGNGRGGFLGDALANVLEAAGYPITREYYVNDAGEQVRKLAASILAAKGYTVSYAPEELYRGEYIEKLAGELQVQSSKSKVQKYDERLLEETTKWAVKILLADIKRVTKKLGITFDVWFSETSLHEKSAVKKMLALLEQKGLMQDAAGARWLTREDAAARNEQEKNRVLVKSNGEPTYLLSDLTYHWNKFRVRRFQKAIDIFGADHHANAQALMAGLSALGLPSPDIILLQLVRLVRDGVEVKMSKRTGTYVTLEELVEEIGADAARWFFLQRTPETHLDFDITLAKERSEKNPVYYVQYAHARIASIMRKSNLKSQISKRVRYDLLNHPSELALMKMLVRLPEFVEEIAESHQAHRLTAYAHDIATAFSVFYRDCTVLSDDSKLTNARLALCRATQIALQNTLRLMGISTPEKM